MRFRSPSLQELDASGLIIVLHDVRDPGNVGTIIRTADAAGATAVVLTGECVDPYNPKTLRATAGSIFHVPVVLESELSSALAWFRANGGETFATLVRGGSPMREADLSTDAMIVFGNESAGLYNNDSAKCSRTLSIEMVGQSESLNVAVAVGVVAFAAYDQRRRRANDDQGPTMMAQ